jgi:hypothetical protein
MRRSAYPDKASRSRAAGHYHASRILALAHPCACHSGRSLLAPLVMTFLVGPLTWLAYEAALKRGIGHSIDFNPA